MHALIDADIFLYEFGTAKKDDGTPLQWPFVVSRMDARIYNILKAVDADSWQLYITDSTDNFRKEIASIKKYKGNRPQEKPYWHEHLYNFLVYHRNAHVVKGMEADDAVGIDQYQSLLLDYDVWSHDDLPEDYPHTVICSRDKDLDMIPGWHYTWQAGQQNEKPLWYQDEVRAWRSFFSQLLTGDSTDNILGLYGVGNNSALLKYIAEFTDPREMCHFVYEEYVKRFGSYWDIFLYENADLIWILRDESEKGSDVVRKFLQENRDIVII